MTPVERALYEIALVMERVYVGEPLTRERTCVICGALRVRRVPHEELAEQHEDGCPVPEMSRLLADEREGRGW